MKKIILLALTALLLAALALGAAAEAALANPWMDCGMDLEKAVELAGFDLKIPALSNYTVRVIPGDTIEVTWPRSETESIALRKSINEPETGDISGDMTEYPKNVVMDVGGVEVTLRGEGDTIHVASFMAFDGAYSVSCAAGMAKSEVAQILKEVIAVNAK